MISLLILLFLQKLLLFLHCWGRFCNVSSEKHLVKCGVFFLLVYCSLQTLRSSLKHSSFFVLAFRKSCALVVKLAYNNYITTGRLICLFWGKGVVFMYCSLSPVDYCLISILSNKDSSLILHFCLHPLPGLSSSWVPAAAMDQVQELLPYSGTNDHHLFTGVKLPLS